MVRPNIDIPNRIHGAVKDYAEEEKVELSKAYKELLEEALEG